MTLITIFGSESYHSEIAPQKMKQNIDLEVLEENIKNSSSKIGVKQLKNEKKEAVETRSKEQRVINILLPLVYIKLYICCFIMSLFIIF